MGRDFEGELIGDLIRQSAIEPDLAPNVMLAVLWAALSNSIPAAFWSTAFLHLPQHRSHLALVLKSLPFASPPDAPPSQASQHLASLVQVGHLCPCNRVCVSHFTSCSMNLSLDSCNLSSRYSVWARRMHQPPC